MSTLLYELTASAARVCTPFPLAPIATPRWLHLLDHWQTLLGSAIGGGLGVSGAMIVARSSRAREQRIAAGMVLPDLQQLFLAAAALERSLPQRRVEGPPLAAGLENMRLEGQRIASAVKRLLERRPTVFALHSAVIGQLSDIDARLYGHLFQCEMAHRRLEEGMTALRVDEEAAPPVAQLYEDWQRCALHARLAHYFLDQFVLRRCPRWVYRCRMRLVPNALDEISRRLLTSGKLPSSMPWPEEPGAPTAA